ncbi:MAG TPA: NAD(P)(+) transhydrogenase (Re/Si-specific) subunit alpha, partial [Thermoanaerobaculia bacterium]|nr:NAD(P)(+) transhydrogenase (Re/Si-specific) subunit alpha [Thermoanaerobaculia bacterium]
LNLAATVPYHASQLYASNVASFLAHLLRDTKPAAAPLPLDTADEITRETLIVHGGEVVHERVRQLLGLAPAASPATAATTPGDGQPPPDPPRPSPTPAAPAPSTA